ncbi:hypothetical protein FQZ97_1221490 [compost metagenome]
MKSLDLAADTFAGVHAWDKHQAALQQATALRQMHKRLGEVLAAQHPTLDPLEHAA